MKQALVAKEVLEQYHIAHYCPQRLDESTSCKAVVNPKVGQNLRKMMSNRS